MPDTLEFQELIAKLRDFVAAEYQRGERDAIARIMHAAQSHGTSAHQDLANSVVTAVRATAIQARPGTKERAPTGAPEAFVRRVLTDVGSAGVIASDIHRFAKTDSERLVSYSAIRLILTNGRDSGWCLNTGGRWFLKGKEGKS